jgi:hypothetical protein
LKKGTGMAPNARGDTQRGLSMIGFLFTAAVVVAVAMIGFRVTPAYIEYYAVQKAMQDTLNTVHDVNNLAEFRRALDGRLNVNYVDSIKSSDIEFSKQGNSVVARASWERKLHLVANAFILLEFEAEASR